MRWTILLIILIGIFTPTLGCGGLSQDDLKRHGIRRPKEEDKPAVANSTPAEAKADGDTEKKEETPKGQTPSKASAAAAAQQEKTGSETGTAHTGKQQDQLASKESPGSAISLPEETIPTQTEKGDPGLLADDFPDSSLPSKERTESSTEAGSQKGLTRKEREAIEEEAARLSAERTLAERKARLARRRAEERAQDQGVDISSTRGASGNLVSSAQFLQDLFDRLVNPEHLIPEEFLRVAEELGVRGASTEALAYYNAWAITTEKPEQWVEQSKWSSALRRPAAALHFGVGIEYTGPLQWLSKVQPIGSRNKTFAGLRRDKVNADFKKYTGELGDRLLIGLDEKNEEATFGSLFQPDPELDKSKVKFNLKWQALPTGFKPESMGPGITFLGGGKRKELLYIADLQNVDILVIFDMNLRQPRSGPMINITTIKLIDVRNGEELNSTRGLNNVRIAYDRQDRSNVDPVEKEFQELFTYVDNSLTLTPFPSSIQPEHAAGRVKELAAGEYSNPLPVLAEMRLYFAQGLIDETMLLEGYQALIGTENARLLARGTIPERVSVVAEYLPKIEPAKK